jgi:tetratricopeptide (TPR) repeat protein
MPSAARKPAESAAAPAEGESALLQIAIGQALGLLQAGDADGVSAVLQKAAALARASETGSYAFGLFFFNIGDPGKALEWFDVSLALNADFPPAHAARGIVLHQLGRPHEALSAFAALAQRDPRDPQAPHMSGVILQGLGRFDEALAAYDAALRIAPDLCDSRVNRGVILDAMGRLDEALAAFDKVAQLRPEDATNLFNRGSVLQRLGRFDEALAAYGAAKIYSAACSKPNPEIDVNSGNVLQSLGRHEAALACYEAALTLRPHYAQAHYNRGLALQRLCRREAALAAYEAAIAAKPAYPEALCNRGNVLAELGRANEALVSFAAALQLKPGFVPALINRANILFEQGHPEAALIACAEVLDVAPDHAQALCIRGAACLRLDRLDEALVSLDKALRIRPDYPEAWLNHGNVLQKQGRFEDSLASYDRALALRPDYPEVLSSRGVAQKELGQFADALAGFNRALHLKPDYPDARNNRAGMFLLQGDFKQGFADFESRWDRTNAPRKTLNLNLPVWSGEPLQGRRILAWDEQGLGDLIHFCRYLPQLMATGADVSFFSRRNMFRLLATLPNVPRLLDRVEELETYDYQIALMSLPYAFGTERDMIPIDVPYLHAEPACAASWAQRLGREGYRIGICWRGNPKINLERNAPLSFFGALAAIPGVRLISLMKDMDADSAAAAKAIGLETLGETFDQGADSFIDTAAVMSNLDLVVTTDTSIAHLAGAMGRPVFLAVKQIPDWRWLAEGDRSPWYPSMRLFRQPQRGAWQPVFEAIAAAVAPRVARHLEE